MHPTKTVPDAVPLAHAKGKGDHQVQRCARNRKGETRAGAMEVRRRARWWNAEKDGKRADGGLCRKEEGDGVRVWREIAEWDGQQVGETKRKVRGQACTQVWKKQRSQRERQREATNRPS